MFNSLKKQNLLFLIELYSTLKIALKKGKNLENVLRYVHTINKFKIENVRENKRD